MPSSNFLSQSLKLLLLLPIIFFSCKKESGNSLFEKIDPSSAGIDFQNQLFESDRLNILTWEYFYNGGGVGIGDLDNDGLPDLVLGANMSNTAVYKNLGNFRFEEKSSSAGIKTLGQWTSGISLVDINADGLLDIYLCMSGPYSMRFRKNHLYINQGNFVFSEEADKYGLADSGHSTQAAFFDFDLDGDLDCYLLTNMMKEVGPNIIVPKDNSGNSINNDRLYRNDGEHFVDVSKEAGIIGEGYGLGLSICDINQDRFPDVFVSNDYLSSDLLWVNQGEGTFEDRASEYFRHTSYSAMGNDVADINGDGLPDLVELDMLPSSQKRQKLMFGETNYNRHRMELMAGYGHQYMRNTLQVNQGPGPDKHPVFADLGQMMGIHQTDWSWAPLLVDLDLDGWRDLLITNGYPRDITNRDFTDYKAGLLFGNNREKVDLGKLALDLAEIEGVHTPNFAYKNKSGTDFEDVSKRWGFAEAGYSNGMATGDLDLDGDLDVVINNIDAPPFIFRNTSADKEKGTWLKIKVIDSGKNVHALGVEVRIWHDGNQQWAYNSPYRGYQSTVESGFFFGLGNSQKVDSIEVSWPDGRVLWLQNKPVNKQMILSGDKLPKRRPHSERPKVAIDGFFQKMTPPDAPGFRHKDKEYPDFQLQSLLPHKHSEQGPKMAVGDVNGDGLKDFFVGGAFDQPGRLFIQDGEGGFVVNELGKNNKLSEDIGATLFDADGDGDLDLYVVSGSVEFPAGHTSYQDRFFLNDGMGNFRWEPNRLPELFYSGSCVLPIDIDQDGDQDLFIGGRAKPGDYTGSDPSCFLINDQGFFTYEGPDIHLALRELSKVTDATRADLNGDGREDLVVVGEWIPVSFLINENGQFNKCEQLSRSEGWWNCIAQGDLDGDGRPEFFLGNRGLNSRLKASKDEPVRMYIKDFDRDGRQEGLITYYLKGEEVPFHSRDDLKKRISGFEKRFPSYESFALAGRKDLFPAETWQAIKTCQVFTFASSILRMTPAGKWELVGMPTPAQYAPVHAILSEDVNGDGKPDLILSGNSESTEVQTGRYDAMSGLCLLGDGKGGLTPLGISASSLYIPGCGRDLKSLDLAGRGKILLATQQNDSLLTFLMPHKGLNPDFGVAKRNTLQGK